MQQIRRQIQLGNLELARLDESNKPVPIQYTDLESTQKTRNNYALLVSKLKELSIDEKAEWVNFKRLHGNQLCKKKKWQEAIDVYLESMLGIEITQKDEEKLKEINVEQKYPILLNIATCNYQLKNYKVAIQLCDKVLSQKHGENNAKAMYKKTHCLIALGEINDAHQLARSLMRLKKQQNHNFRSKNDISKENITQLLEEIAGKRKNQKELYQKMFDPKDEEEEGLLPLESKREAEKQEIIDYQYGFKEQCLDWCKETWENVWSCLSRKPSTIKKEE